MLLKNCTFSFPMFQFWIKYDNQMTCNLPNLSLFIDQTNQILFVEFI